MMDRKGEALAAQTQYYIRTGAQYDEQQVHPMDEHANALVWLATLIDQRQYRSVLDIGSGTGRALLYLKGWPGLLLRGIEPSQTLRESGFAKGLTLSEITFGDALALKFADASFDVVCAFWVLHHIRDHRRVVSEMCRVAKHAVFISDANNFGQGGASNRAIKQSLHALGLWKLFDYARSGFKGYHFSERRRVFLFLLITQRRTKNSFKISRRFLHEYKAERSESVQVGTDHRNLCNARARKPTRRLNGCCCLRMRGLALLNIRGAPAHRGNS